MYALELKPKLDELAASGIYLGTSSWKFGARHNTQVGLGCFMMNPVTSIAEVCGIEV